MLECQSVRHHRYPVRIALKDLDALARLSRPRPAPRGGSRPRPAPSRFRVFRNLVCIAIPGP